MVFEDDLVFFLEWLDANEVNEWADTGRSHEDVARLYVTEELT